MHFKSLDLMEFLMCQCISLCTLLVTWYIKMIISFLPGIGKHFIGNMLCSSDNSVMHVIAILHFVTINNVLHKSSEEKSPEESNLENGEGEWVLSSYPTVRLPV